VGTVTKLQSVIWSELADLCQNEQKHMADARALWPEIAARMAQLRKDYPSNDEFGIALVQHGIEYNGHDRAAFIWMGSLRRSVLEDAIALCDRKSPKHFRTEVESWPDDYFKASCPSGQDTAEDSHPAESPENALPAGESAPVAIPEGEKTEKPVGSRTWDARSLLFALGDDARLLQAVLGKNAASAISPLMPKHNKFLRFIIDKMKTGSLQLKAFNSHVFHARQLIPTLDKTFVGEMEFSRKEGRPNGKAISLFMEHFDLMQRAAASGWSYAEFLRATNGNTPAARPATAAEVWAQQRPPVLTTEGLPETATLADGTELSPEPIYVCGVCLFPSESRKDLSYVDAYMHTHDCRDWVSHMSASNVQEVGMHLAHRGLQFGRQYKAIGSFLSALGTAIRGHGAEMERELWFKLEPFKNRTTVK
jgi:hypothetical protein